MDRRDFLRKAGAGSAALASFPALGALATGAAAHEGGTGWHFLAISRAGVEGDVDHWVAMRGDGTATESDVHGGGHFIHFDNASPVPRRILGAGTWRARRLRSFSTIGTWGVFAAGVIEVDVELIADIPSHRHVTATLEVACNLGFAGLFTGKDEGFTLAVPGAPAPFKPLVPPLGLTVLTTVPVKKR